MGANQPLTSISCTASTPNHDGLLDDRRLPLPPTYGKPCTGDEQCVLVFSSQCNPYPNPIGRRRKIGTQQTGYIHVSCLGFELSRFKFFMFPMGFSVNHNHPLLRHNLVPRPVYVTGWMPTFVMELFWYRCGPPYCRAAGLSIGGRGGLPGQHDRNSTTSPPTTTTTYIQQTPTALFEKHKKHTFGRTHAHTFAACIAEATSVTHGAAAVVF